MINFEAVAARYPRQPVLALDGVTLAAPAGQVTAVVGPNGSGKSTLVRALLGRIPLERGRITIDGDDVAALSPRDRARRVAVVPHLARATGLRTQRPLLAAAALIGAALVVAADVAARIARPPAELPLGAVTALIGVPFFLARLRSLR